MGDFNINLLNVNQHTATNEFLENMYSLHFLPLITKPTRVQSNSATLIDNIFSNQLNNIISGVLYTDISDHYPIFVIIENNHIKSKIDQNIFYKRDYSPKNIDKFKDMVNKVQWTEILKQTECNQAFSLFYKKFSELYNQGFPSRDVKKTYYNRKPWLTPALITSIKNKNNLYRKFKKNPNANNSLIYRIYRNKLNNILKTAEKSHFDSLFKKNASNIKKSWQIIKNIINKQHEIIA